MKSTIPFICAALTSTSAFAQQSPSQPSSDGAEHPTAELFFDFDSASLPLGNAELAPIVQWSKDHPSGSVVLDGSADSVGPATYNIRLSARRAEAVRDKLIAMGVESDRIVLAFYGEDALRRTSAELDRRVTIWTTHDPIYAIVDDSLVRGTAVLWTRPVTYAELHPSTTTVATR